MKVLAITNLYPTASEPTRGVFSRNRFLSLAQHCDVRLVSPLPWWSRCRRPGAWFTAPRENWTGIDASFPSYWSVPGWTSLHGAAMHVSLRRYIASLRQEFAFDVILAAWAYPDGVASALLADDFGCPLVTMVLGSDVNELASKPALREQITRGLQRAHRVIAVSDALGARVVDLGVEPGRVVVQHNGVDGSRFILRDKSAARKHIGLPQDRRLVCFVGNLKPEKGPRVVVDALDHLRSTGTADVNLVLVGDGPLLQALREQADKLGLQDHVLFCGRQPHDCIPDYITACDALCLPSFREGCPNVVLEALASGRPVVASSVGGVPELLGEHNGAIVPPGDSVALAVSLRQVLSRSWDPEELRSSVRCLSWDVFGQTLHSVLTEAVEGQHPAGTPRGMRDALTVADQAR